MRHKFDEGDRDPSINAHGLAPNSSPRQQVSGSRSPMETDEWLTELRKPLAGLPERRPVPALRPPPPTPHYLIRLRVGDHDCTRPDHRGNRDRFPRFGLILETGYQFIPRSYRVRRMSWIDFVRLCF